jgi:hypothetical protein
MAEPDPIDVLIATAVADALCLQAAAIAANLVVSDDVALSSAIALEAMLDVEA